MANRARAQADTIKANLKSGLAILSQSKQGQADPTLNILTLSGGGQWGAYGSGFLAGWAESGQRPSFDIVTGVSTGSLIATFAFLGSPADDAALKKGYLGIDDSDVYQPRYEMLIPFVINFSNSLTRTQRLRSLIESIATPEVVARVAQEHDKGRRLYVGAVNMDMGRFETFDLTEIARNGGTQAYTRYIDCLMASAAIPVFFEPIYIDGFQYVDGGVMRNVFMENMFSEDENILCDDQYCWYNKAINTYVLLNGSVEARGEFIKDRFISIGIRSLELLQDERMIGNVFRISEMVSSNKHVSVNLRIHSIPITIESDFKLDKPYNETKHALKSSEHAFDTEYMSLLYHAALAHGKTAAKPLGKGGPWFDKVEDWEQSILAPGDPAMRSKKK